MQWYALTNAKGQRCGKLKTDNPADNYATRMGMTLSPIDGPLVNPIATDQKTVAERQWQKPKLAPKPQNACDHGLFSDEASQLDLVEMLMEPTNEG